MNTIDRILTQVHFIVRLGRFKILRSNHAKEIKEREPFPRTDFFAIWLYVFGSLNLFWWD